MSTITNEPIVEKVLAQRFLRLFQGLERAHGASRLTGEVGDNGKRKNEGRLVKAPLTLELAELHLAGAGDRRGALPLRDDSKVFFGAGDVDDYAGLDHRDLAKRAAEIEPNLVVARSKSGGAHFYLFAAEPAEAASMREALRQAAKNLGLPESIEIFPKADQMEPSQFSGGWVHLPYYGDECKAIRPDGTEMSLPEFLDWAESRRVANPDAKPKKDYQRGAGEGNRWQYVKSDIGRYLRAHPEADLDKLLRYSDYVRTLLDPPVPDSEWRKWNVKNLCAGLIKKQSDQGPRSEKAKTAHELILETVEEIRERFTIATDAVGRVHVYDDAAGCWKFDDNKAFKNILLKRLSGNRKPLAMGDADVEKMLLHLNLDSTPQFWEEPPRNRINVQNGILNLDTLLLEPHSPDFLYPNQFDTPWIPDASCPGTDEILGQIFWTDEEVRAVYEILGYCLVPVTEYHAAFLFKGSGANGKTAVLNLIRNIMGRRNCSAVTLHQMEGNNFAAHQMVGKLLNIEADMSEKKLPSSAKFKAIVGGDPITVEQKYKDPRTVKLYTRLLVSANWYPRSTDSSPGFFRRWVVLAFDKKDFRDEGANASERISSTVLDAKIMAEAPGILNKAVKAFQAVHSRGGFTISQRMKDAKAEFRALTDSVSLWLEDSTMIGPDLKVSQEQLRNAYNRFCDSKDYPRLTPREFSEKVLEFSPGVRSDRLGHNEHYFVGVGMKATDGPLLDTGGM